MCVSIIKERFFESSAAGRLVGKPPKEVICERLLVDPRQNKERCDKAFKDIKDEHENEVLYNEVARIFKAQGTAIG